MVDIKALLAQAEFYSDGEAYVLVKLHARAITAAASVIAEISDPFCALIVDKDEVSLVVPPDALEEFASRLRDAVTSTERYRLITVDIEVPLDAAGFMALLAGALAARQIPVFTYAAYSRDHLLVPEAQFDAALESLKHLARQ